MSGAKVTANSDINMDDGEQALDVVLIDPANVIVPPPEMRS